MFEEAEEIAKDIYIHYFDDDINYPDVLKATRFLLLSWRFEI